jgi:hypothetical protein
VLTQQKKTPGVDATGLAVEPMSLFKLILRYVLRPVGRAIGTDRFEPHVTGGVHCLVCGHRFVLVTLAQQAACEDDGPIDDVMCTRCGRELVFWDGEE